MSLEKRLIEYWQRNSLTNGGDTVIVACSGGPDSLALLDLLWKLKEGLEIRVVAAHYEHGIRGQASREDEAFVKRFCHERDIPFYSESGNIPQLSRESGESLETCARRMRYGFLHKLSQRFDNGIIATAHHADDQAETVMMHFLRGTGLKGLTGILPKRDNIIRPLLPFVKAELVEYCHKQGLEPRQDATNDETDCTRNKIRLHLLPLLKSEYNSNITQGMCNLAATASAEEKLLHDLTCQTAARLCSQEGQEKGCYKFSASEFLKEPLAIRRRLIQYLVQKISHGTTLTFRQVEAILELIEKNVTGSSLDLPNGCVAKISYGIFNLLKKTENILPSHGTIEDTPYKIILSLGSTVALPGGGAISAYVTDSLEGEGPFSKDKIYCDADKCGIELIVRYRREGDRIRLKAGSKKLKDFFVDAKVERSSRDRMPLVVSPVTGEIIWVAGLRQTATALADGNTKQYVILSYVKGEK
ncbi:tRNA lysidine(34) synthetase TilS [Anaerovibrio sp. RM50]|uniref:tRNA lysidine(34) synthetase TilS n=1 Tax=Anaerovibrio sp. RM50 TaxID=1200557 RepID=UPI0004854659|nr:tRNA lysidine(34) synthetase TilS [Anaerovibrio sp. RM50]